MNKRTKKLEKGITLIALIITIIVLLILAGVTISMLTGENGILNRAVSAKETNSKSELEEQVKLAVMASRVNDTASINLKTLEEELNKISGATITKGTDDNLPWTVKKENYEVTITVEGKITTDTTEKDNGNEDDEAETDYGTKKPSEDTRDVIDQATDAKPSGAIIDSNNNDSDTGIVMIDENGNEWVWVEVPASVFTSATSKTDYENIKADLIAYATDYRGSYTDEWYDGCGIASADEYNTKYQIMLSSVYENKGFYISRYEAGIEGSDTDISLARTSSSSRITDTTITTLPKAVSKKGMIPYNFVYCSEAQQLANGMSTGSKTSSLLFGIQWDLTCKFLEVKSDLEVADINSNSTSWGNYSNSQIINLSGKYAICSQSSYTLGAWNTIPSGYEKPSSGTENKVLLSTGASEYTNRMNIYDLAGNGWEWTLEYSGATYAPCATRGGTYKNTGSDRPSSDRGVSIVSGYSDFDVFRISLY